MDRGPDESTPDGLQCLLWRAVQASEDSLIDPFPVRREHVRKILHYVEDLETALAKATGDDDGQSLPKLRVG